MLIVTSSQFRNKDFVTINGIVVGYSVDDLMCNQGKTACYSSYANIDFGANSYCIILADEGNYDYNDALAIAQRKYILNSSITSYRRIGTYNCVSQKRNNNTAIIGVILITISGILILGLPCYYRYLISTVIDDSGPGKVHVAEAIGLTAKESQARADAAAVAAARRSTIQLNKAQNEQTQARVIAELVSSNKKTIAINTNTNSNEWSSINPNMQIQP